MGKSPISGVSSTPFLIIFTDLDGTLLDHCTYGWEEALPALDLCKRLRVPVILASSKTLSEMERLRKKLSISAPFITENGGGIFFPDENFETPTPEASSYKGLWRLSLGEPYDRLIRELKEIRAELDWNIRGFSDMSIEEIADLTGLDEETSRLAAMREYDEPFIILEKKPLDMKALFKAVAKRGLTVIVGGRFYHLQGKNDKGQAMEKVTSWYRESYGEVVTVALGDSFNDVPMLKLADHPFLVRSQSDLTTLKKKIPLLRVTLEMGPKGWNSAVMNILGKKEEKGNVRQFRKRGQP